MSYVPKVLRRWIESQLRQKGYYVEWNPDSIRRRESRLDCYFDFAAAHLMLTRKDIYFIEIGANDGIANDPVFPYVEDYGWNGIMIEPHVHAQLVHNLRDHKGVKCIQAAVAESDGVAQLYTIPAGSSSFKKANQFSSLRRDVVESQGAWVENVNNVISVVEVPTISWASLLSLAGERRVDVLQLDVEGYEAEILARIDFQRSAPQLIHYERCNLSKGDQVVCANLLARHGYRLAQDDLDVTAYRMP